MVSGLNAMMTSRTQSKLLQATILLLVTQSTMPFAVQVQPYNIGVDGYAQAPYRQGDTPETALPYRQAKRLADDGLVWSGESRNFDYVLPLQLLWNSLRRKTNYNGKSSTSEYH